MRLHQTKKLCIAKELINKMNKPKKWEKKMFASYILCQGNQAFYDNHMGNLHAWHKWATHEGKGQNTLVLEIMGTVCWDAGGPCLGTQAWRHDGHPLC